MRRRDFIKAIAGSTTAWPLAARAQQSDQMRRLGVLTMFGANDPAGQARGAALIEGLAALNWQEGRNLRIDWRATGGDPALYDRCAAELVALGPDVLVAVGTPAVAALRRRTT